MLTNLQQSEGLTILKQLWKLIQMWWLTMETAGKDAICLRGTKKGGESIQIMLIRILPGPFYIGKLLLDISTKQVLR